MSPDNYRTQISIDPRRPYIAHPLCNLTFACYLSCTYCASCLIHPMAVFKGLKKTKEWLKNEINVIKCIVHSDYWSIVIILIIKEHFKREDVNAGV